MSTYDVPGANPDNNDELAMGCWAEHDDGSLIFVESTEGSRVVYSIFDMSKTPTVEYRDAMPETSFKRTFTWKKDSKRKGGEKWLWHDKTAFPWDRLIKQGGQDAGRHVSADDILTAAERVAASLKLRGGSLANDMRHRADRTVQASTARAGIIWDKISRAIGELRK
jgi:hypothetical protein